VFWTFAQPSELASGTVTIDGPRGHHLARALRVRPGERGVVVGGGLEHDVEVVEVGGSRVVARLIGERPVTGEPETAITLWQAVLPNADFDSVIENGTAVGVRRFVAIQAARSIARPAAARLSRWQSIAGSAAEQSHRGLVPSLAGPMTLGEALRHELDASRLLILDPGAPDTLAAASGGSRAYTLLSQHGARRVNLGARILRARLAPVIAAAILVQQS
jgi:16S rRNA (uracil1498-N3)-methyltransferase